MFLKFYIQFSEQKNIAKSPYDLLYRAVQTMSLNTNYKEKQSDCPAGSPGQVEGV